MTGQPAATGARREADFVGGIRRRYRTRFGKLRCCLNSIAAARLAASRKGFPCAQPAVIRRLVRPIRVSRSPGNRGIACLTRLWAADPAGTSGRRQIRWPCVEYLLCESPAAARTVSPFQPIKFYLLPKQLLQIAALTFPADRAGNPSNAKTKGRPSCQKRHLICSPGGVTASLMTVMPTSIRWHRVKPTS